MARCRRTLPVLVATVLLLLAVGRATAASFPDTAGSPYADAIDYITALGIAAGYPDGGFHPDAPVSREQFAAFTVRLLGDDGLATAAASVEPNYTDGAAIDPWAYGYVTLIQSLGLMRGYPDGSFQPQRPVTIAEAAAVLVRALNGDRYARLLGGDWPASYLAAARNLGLFGRNAVNSHAQTVHVSADGTSAAASRGQVAQLLYNAGWAPRVTYDASGSASLGGAGANAPLFASNQ